MPRLLDSYRVSSVQTSDAGMRVVSDCTLKSDVGPEGGVLFRKAVRHKKVAGAFVVVGRVSEKPRQIHAEISYRGRSSFRGNVRTTVAVSKGPDSDKLKGASQELINGGTINSAFAIRSDFRGLGANTLVSVSVDVVFPGVWRDGDGGDAAKISTTTSSSSSSSSNGSRSDEDIASDEESDDEDIEVDDDLNIGQDHAAEPVDQRLDGQVVPDNAGDLQNAPARQFTAFYNRIVLEAETLEPRTDEDEEDIEDVWGDLGS